MKPVLKMLPALFAITLFTSCNNYGKKVTVDGTKGEVYYKGEGVTESDAKKLGDFLKKEEFFTNDKVKSVQITKGADRYTVHFVVDKDALTKIPTAEQGFKEYTVQMTKEVFGGTKTDVALSDDQLKDFKTIPYDETFANTNNGNTQTDKGGTVDLSNQGKTGPGNDGNTSTPNTTTSLADYDHDVAGGITFYWKGISDDESKTIADYIVKNGSFAGGNGKVSIVMEKQGDRYLVKFPVADGYREDASYLNTIGNVSKQIKDNVFANQSYTFVMTDTELRNVRSWDY